MRTDGLVVVRGLLGPDTVATVLVVVGRAAGAAADGEQPEDVGGEREGGGEPSGGVDVRAQVTGDAIGLEVALHGALEDDEHGGRGGGGGDGEQAGGGREDEDHAAAPAAADGEDRQDEGEAGRDEGDNVRDEHPLGHGLVGLHAIVVRAGQLIPHRFGVDVPDLERVEVELGLGLGAEGVGELIAVLDAAVAVAPETDVVEVLQVDILLDGIDEVLHLLDTDLILEVGVLQDRFDLLCCFRRGRDVLGVDLSAGVSVSDYSRSGGGGGGCTYPEEVQVVLGAGLGIGAADANEDQADQRGDGEHIGREDTRDTTDFAHGD